MTDLAVDPRELVSAADDALPAGAPWIGVIVSLCFPGMDEEGHELMTRFTRTAFDAVREAGGRPLLIDSAAAEHPSAAEVLAGVDGLLFLGGGDLDGELYGLPKHAQNSYGVDRAADDFCLAVMRDAVAADLAVFAVCRGSQLLNVALGGTLIPDLQPKTLHQGGPGQPMFLDEEVRLSVGSKVAAALGDRELVTVRSGHHQAVDRLGEGLVVTATAHDGVIEGTEHTDRRWVVGVQWHPEDSHGSAADRAALFGAFVAEVASRG